MQTVDKRGPWRWWEYALLTGGLVVVAIILWAAWGFPGLLWG